MPTLLGIKDGSFSANFSLEKKDKFTIRVKKFSKTYYVLADSLADTEEEIVATSGIPGLFSLDNGARVKTQDPKETTRVIHPVTAVATSIWEVGINWDSSVDDDDEDPENKPPKIRWSGEVEEELLEEDAVTGDPVQTDAEEPQLISTPIVLPILEVKRYEFFPFDPSTMLEFAHHTNATSFWGAPAGAALMLPMEADEETIEDIRYAVVTYRIKFKIKPGVTEPWKARVLHHGFKYREKVGAKPSIYQDKFGNPATINLAVGGTKAKDGDPPNYKEWNRFTKAEFNALGLGPF